MVDDSEVDVPEVRARLVGGEDEIGPGSAFYEGGFSALDEVDSIGRVALQVDVVAFADFVRLEFGSKGSHELRSLPFEEANSSELVGVDDVGEVDLKFGREFSHEVAFLAHVHLVVVVQRLSQFPVELKAQVVLVSEVRQHSQLV